MFGWAVLMYNLQKSILEHNLANTLIFLCLLYTSLYYELVSCKFSQLSFKVVVLNAFDWHVKFTSLCRAQHCASELGAATSTKI